MILQKGKNIINFYFTFHSTNEDGAFVVTSTQNHRIIHLFNIIKILNKFKIFQDRIRKFSNNIDLRKLDFLSPEKINEHSRFVNKDITQS